MRKLKILALAAIASIAYTANVFASESYVITRNNTVWMKVEKDANGSYNASSDDSSSARLVKDGGTVTTSSNENYRIKYTQDKITLTRQDGGDYLQIKDDGEKLKVRISGQPQQWSIKKKDDKDAYKIKQGDNNFGKVKFYPEKSKVKAKDEAGTEVCMMRANALKPAPALCLMNDIAQKDKLMLFLLFVAYDLR